MQQDNTSRSPRARSVAFATAVVVALAAVLVASAAAGTIRGTAKNDTLRGSTKADKLYGFAGNDKLYGFAGNDYLNGGPGNDSISGGPGADVLACGPGKDTAVADAADKVGADCETVVGLPKPPLSAVDTSLAEGNAPQSLSVTVSLAKASPLRVTVAYATADGSATAGTDYTATSGTLVFAPGETSKSVAVPVLGDTTYESDESFTLNLSGPVNAQLAKATATATITNDDPIAKPGHYHGTITGGNSIDFDVAADGKSLANVAIDYQSQCQPAATLHDAFRISNPITIQADGSFQVVGTGQGFVFLINGKFAAEGGAAGTLKIHDSFDYQGTHYECDTGNTAWTAAAA
jgi:Ca2+-binding RTX toxin-like protein